MRRWGKRIAVFSALLAVILAGCSSQEVTSERGVGTVAPVASPASQRPARMPVRRPRSTTVGLRTSVSSREAPAEEVPAEPTQGPSRDLAGELRAAFGSPQPCLPPGSLPGGQGTATVSVVVSLSGRVTRASLQAPVARDVARCLREQAERVTFAGPIAGAPVSVSAQLRLSAPPLPEPQERAFVLPAGAEPPAVVLPARVDTGMPEGFVPAGRTLPARVDTGRPDGFVPPSRTLPAQADAR